MAAGGCEERAKEIDGMACHRLSMRFSRGHRQAPMRCISATNSAMASVQGLLYSRQFI